MKNYLLAMKLVFNSILIFTIGAGCGDNITNPLNGSNVICYEKSYNNHWEIFANNITATDPQNISNFSSDNESPQWSPDGRYIVYSRSQSVGGLLIIVYDTKNQTSRDLSDGGGAILKPQWTPNGNVCFVIHFSPLNIRGHIS